MLNAIKNTHLNGSIGFDFKSDLLNKKWSCDILCEWLLSGLIHPHSFFKHLLASAQENAHEMCSKNTAEPFSFAA